MLDFMELWRSWACVHRKFHCSSHIWNRQSGNSSSKFFADFLAYGETKVITWVLSVSIMDILM